MTRAVAEPQLITIPLEHLLESEHNPRTRFDPTELREMADSLLASGQLTPILVRPHPKKKGAYEIAAGACRRRSAELAGLAGLSAIVRDLDDATFVEIVNVENRQRNNLDALDEARGFADWMKTAGLKIQDIATRIGLSEKYVYDRLKLLQLIPAAQKLLADRVITPGHAILLARLMKDDQERAIGDSDDPYNNRITGLFTVERLRHEETALDLDDSRAPRKPVSVREFSEWIEEHVRFRPGSEDPNLWPETATAVREAITNKEKVLRITRDLKLPEDAKDKTERTYLGDSWKRADGQDDEDVDGERVTGATCDYGVLGVIVAGRGRGESFQVCVAKKKCRAHWADEMREAQKAEAYASRGAGKTRSDDVDDRPSPATVAHNAELVRWQQAREALLDAAYQAVRKAPTGDTSPAGRAALEPGKWGRNKKRAWGNTAADVVRMLAFDEIEEVFGYTLNAEMITKLFKGYGVNAKAIVDKVAPKPAVEKKPAPAAAKPKKKLAGDVRRAEAKTKKKAKAKR